MKVNNKIILIISLAVIVFISACNDKETPAPSVSPYTEGGVFVVNEGNYTSANSSLSYYYPDSNSVVNNVFYRANNVPLGDVAQSMTIHNNLAYITINNSGHIYVTDVSTSKYAGKIEGLISPREVAIINNTKAYITDFTSKSITIANPETYEVTGSVPVGKSTEAIVQTNSKVFVSNWSSYNQTTINNTVMVIDPANDIITDSIIVGIEPVSMVIDKNDKLWVLCSGGYLGEEHPTLWRINTIDNIVEETFYFDDINSSPDNLCINKAKDTLYYLNKSIYTMSIDDSNLPATALIDSGDKNFYAMGVNPENGDIYISDALDYSHNGTIYRYTHTGLLITSFETGIIPGAFCFYQASL